MIYSHESGRVQIPKEMVRELVAPRKAGHQARGTNSGLFSQMDLLIMRNQLNRLNQSEQKLGQGRNSKNYGVGLGSTIDNSTFQYWGVGTKDPKNSIHEFSHIAIISSQLVTLQCYIPPIATMQLPKEMLSGMRVGELSSSIWPAASEVCPHP